MTDTVQADRVPDVDIEADAYHLFFESSPRPMYVFDRRSFEVLDANEAAVAMYGYDRDELLAMTVLELRPPDEVPRFLRMIQEGHVGDGVWHHRRKDGSIVDVETGWTQLRYRGRDAQLTVVTDVSDREAMLMELAISRDRFRTVVEACPLGIMVTDPSYHIIDVNPALCQLVGYDAAQLRTMTFLDITHPDDVGIDDELATYLFEGSIPHYSLEKRYLTADGGVVWVKLTAAAVFDDQGQAVAGVDIIEDISESKLADDRRREVSAEAAGRLSALTQREREILDRAAAGLTAREIAQHFTISARTAESHLASVYRKLGVTSRSAALHEYSQILEVASPGNPLPRNRYARGIRRLRT